VAERLLRVAHLIDPPARVNDPRLLARIVAANARQQYAKIQKTKISAGQRHPLGQNRAVDRL
jgi:hypothetical protein